MSLSSSARLRAAVALSAAAGGIHLAVVQEHLREGWMVGLFFVVVGTGQVAWAARVAADPSRPLLVVGAVGSGGLVGLWVLSRTASLPLGAHPGAPEPVGLPDLLASAFEVGVVWGALASAAHGRSRRARADAGGVAERGGPRSSLPPLPRWVTVREAALLAGTSEDAVRAWVRQGRVAARTLTLSTSGLTLVRSDHLLALAPVDLAAWGLDPPTPPTPEAPRRAAPVLSRAGAWALAATCLVAATAGGLVLTERLVSGSERNAGVRGDGHEAGHHARTEAHGAEGGPAPGARQPAPSAGVASTRPSQPSPPATAQAAVDPARPLLRTVHGRPVVGGPRMPCRRLLRTADGSCGRARMAGGRVAWTVERSLHGPVVRLYGFSRERGTWVPRLRAGGPDQALRRAQVRTADLTGDARPELVAGFRLRGLEGLSYEVLTFPRGRRLGVALHAWVAHGRVRVQPGRINEYYELPRSDPCCARYLRVVVRWDGSAFRPVSAGGPLPASSLPPSDF